MVYAVSLRFEWHGSNPSISESGLTLVNRVELVFQNTKSRIWVNIPDKIPPIGSKLNFTKKKNFGRGSGLRGL